jgi:tetratricopeptide (TPR) repeat protein
MRYLLLIFLLGNLSLTLNGQSVVKNLVKIGIDLHDKGDYEGAIDVYKQALNIDPNSALVHYEIAMTYMYAKDFENCIRHSDIVIDLNGQYLLPAYVTKGSCLDYMGRTDESISLFKKGLKKFGDHFLLYYNLGYNYYQIQDYEKARETLILSINTNSRHTSSHLLLGYLMNDMNNKVQSLLCLYYFLYLEPDSPRARQAYDLLQDQFTGHVERDAEKPGQINIFIDPDSESEFGAANMLISMLEASNTLEENKGKSEEELFIENTRSFFSILGELKKKKNHGLWWEFYTPFFYDLAKSKHIDTFCYYIIQSSNEKAGQWLEAHPDNFDQFKEWLQQY